MKDYAFLFLLLATFAFAIWLDNHPPSLPDLTPFIDRAMNAIDPLK